MSSQRAVAIATRSTFLFFFSFFFLSLASTIL
jgi:hypothetical protein